MAREIPDKLYFRIGEVAGIVGVKPHVLRYWESEFECIKPTKSRSQQRLFRRQDIEIILQIKELLQQRGYTIAGARKTLQKAQGTNRQRPGDSAQSVQAQSERLLLLREIRADLRRLRDSLANRLRP